MGTPYFQWLTGYLSVERCVLSNICPISVGERLRIAADTDAILEAFVIGMGLVAKRLEHEPNSEPPKCVIKLMNRNMKPMVTVWCRRPISGQTALLR